MGIQINGQTDTVTSTTAGGSVTVTPLAASGGLNVGTGASISSPATNVLTLGTNNSERVRITDIGRVGIGTNIPAGQLDVRGSVYVDNNAVNLTYLTKSFSPSHVASSRGAKIRIGLDDGSFSGVEVENTVGNNGSYNSQNVHLINHDGGVAGDTYSLTARYDGRIGIGITNPLTKVHIQGTGNASSGSTGLSDSSSASALLLKPTIGSGTALALGTRATGGHYIQGLYAASSVDSVRDVQINPYGGSVGIGTFADAFGGVPGNSTFVVGTTGIERLRIDSSGRLTLPYQPSGAWYLNVSAGGVRSVSIRKNIGNCISSVGGGNGSNGSVGRFTAPVAGAYLISLFASAVSSSSQCLMSVYGSWTSATNNVYATQEVFDCRVTRPPEDGGGWSQVFYFNATDYWEIDWYRPGAPTSYIDSGMTMNVTVHLLG